MADKIIKDIYIVSRISKAGNPYKNLVIEFMSGYTVQFFLTNEQAFCMSDIEVRQ